LRKLRIDNDMSRSKKHARQSRWEALSRVLPALFPTEAAQEVSALEPLTAGRTEM
jgi:hypothetical protein